ncbi:MAG: transposase [Verrucomicrobia bacterium]|nr:transposase [Verrucomicrobiota bacterium]
MTIQTRSPRLRRLDRTFARVPIYYITACTHNRRLLLNNADVHDTFVHFAREAANRGAWVGAYVLMPDHLHLFVGFDEQRMNISSWAKSLKNTLSKAMRLQGIPSPHWQKTFLDHVLRSEESYESKWSYVRENPVRGGLVKRWKDWPYVGEVHDLPFA